MAVTYVREVIVNVEGNAILQDFLQGPLFDYSIDMRFAVCYMDVRDSKCLNLSTFEQKHHYMILSSFTITSKKKINK